MPAVKHCFLILFISLDLRVTNTEILPFFTSDDQVFVQCSNGKLEFFNSTSNSLPSCVQTMTQIERFNFFQLYIQCPDGRLHLEYNRTIPFNAQIPEYSMVSLQPYCFLEHVNAQHQFIPYQTRYTSENGTFTQIISFRCQYNSTIITNERWKFNEQFDLYLKLMNYGLCRYTIQFIYSNGKCNQFYQQIYKIPAQVKTSKCYYKLENHPTEISLEYFEQLTSINLSSSIHFSHSRKSVRRTLIIITASITGLSLVLCLMLGIAMYQFGLFRT